MNKNELLEHIIGFYLTSGDFNGIPMYHLQNYNPKDMVELINDGLVETISESEAINPHIKGFEFALTTEQHITNAAGDNGQVFFYPTEKALQSVPVDYSKPYTALLQKGRAQFDIIFFDIEVLERYINNPKYSISDYGYKGSVCLQDAYGEDSSHGEYIKEYGMAYKRCEKLIRAVAVFIRDLSRLSPRAQMLWKSFEHANQAEYFVESGFIKNAIFGAFVTTHWVFNAMLEEMEIINQQCEAIGLPPLFNHIYRTSHNERPDGYGNILLPTLKNYYDFVLVMEKLLVHNISIKTFQKDVGVIRAIDRKNEDGTDKGSLAMFKEWIEQNVRASFDIDAIIIAPLKKIRKIRQSPAHELYSNEYDVDVYERQKELVDEAYEALRAIRSLFMGHPLAKNVKIPAYILNGKDIVFY
ncbi:MAG: AAA family ATPase [Christensenellales bacterium]